MEGITRYARKKHFTSTQHRSLFKEIIGPESYILEANEKLEPELQSNNLLRIRSGMLCHHGFVSEIKKNTYDEVTINNGTQGMKRADLVVLRHTRNTETEVEDCEWVVIRGTPSASAPVIPECISGDINNGDLVDDCPVFKVELDGIQVVNVEKLLETLGGTLAGQAKELAELNGNMEALSTVKVEDRTISQASSDISTLTVQNATSIIGVYAYRGTSTGTAFAWITGVEIFPNTNTVLVHYNGSITSIKLLIVYI